MVNISGIKYRCSGFIRLFTHKVRRAGLVGSLVPLLLPLFFLDQPQVIQKEVSAQADCQSLLEGYIDDPEALQQLANPIADNLSELDDLRRTYTILFECLQKLPVDQFSDSHYQIERLVAYFLAFASESTQAADRSQSFLVDLSTSDDPAVSILRDEIGIPSPDGYVFIQHYPSRQAMPGIIQPYFEDPQVAGVTILGRYIAILNQPEASWSKLALRDQVLPGTISHELVHAYVNSAIAESYPPNAGNFPVWFDEGLATYISQNDRKHTIVTTQSVITQSASDDYIRYAQIFQYLENRFGKDQLNEKIRRAIETGDAGQVYSGLDIPNDRWLEETVDAWQSQRIQQRTIFGLILLSAVFLGLYISLPELECTCGFTGRRGDFTDGQCPDCGRQVEGAQRQSVTQSEIFIYPDCQVCGKRFFPWQRRQLHFYKRFVRVWKENPSGETRPLAQYVHRVCNECYSNSQYLENKTHQLAALEIEYAKQAYHPIYFNWLSNAPQYSISALDAIELTVEQAVQQFLQSALAPYWHDWLNQPPDFNLIDLDQDIDPQFGIVRPPPVYTDVIQNATNGKIGSVYRNQENWIIISWD